VVGGSKREFRVENPRRFHILDIVSVPAVGGLPRALDGTGRLFVVHPGLPKYKKAVPEPDGESRRVRHLRLGQDGWTAGVAADSREPLGTAGNSEGRQRTARDCKRLLQIVVPKEIICGWTPTQ